VNLQQHRCENPISVVSGGIRNSTTRDFKFNRYGWDRWDSKLYCEDLDGGSRTVEVPQSILFPWLGRIGVRTITREFGLNFKEALDTFTTSRSDAEWSVPLQADGTVPVTADHQHSAKRQEAEHRTLRIQFEISPVIFHLPSDIHDITA
jgi:hypothetical protein